MDAVSLPDGWSKTSAVDDPELLRVEHVIARWTGPGLGREVALTEDGNLVAAGPMPVELLPYVMSEWWISQRGKIA